MLVNGKFVLPDEKKAAELQDKLNKNDDISNNVKSEIEKPKEILNDNNGGIPTESFSIFNETDVSNTRESYYEIYKEMSKMEFIHKALEIVSDDACQKNQEGYVLDIISNSEKTKDILKDLFIKRLDMNNELWNIVFDTAKLGDNFFEIVPNDYKKPKQVNFLRYLNPEKIKRVEAQGRISHYEYTYLKPSETGQNQQESEQVVIKLQPWQVVHFKVANDRETDPYGASLLKAGIKTFRRLDLLEDVILIYRISRAPERRVFNIDVGKMNYTDANKFIQKIKKQYRTKNVIDENGNIDKKSNILSTTSDIFIPKREGSSGTQVDTLQGGEGLKAIDDLKYFKDKILNVVNIPSTYISDEADRSRGSLANNDIRFAKFEERIQTQINIGLLKIATIELFFQGFKKEELSDFQIELTPPSNIKETIALETMGSKMELISTIQQLELFPKSWILKKIMKFSDREVNDIISQKQLEDGEGGEDGEASIGGEAGGEEMGAIPGGEAGGGEEELAASTMINVLGKDFIFENKEDFFKIKNEVKKYQESEKELQKSKVFSYLENLFEDFEPPKKEKRGINNNKKMFIIKEFKGLNFDIMKNPESFNLFEKETGREEEILLDE